MHTRRLKAAVIGMCGLASVIVAATTIESVQAQARQPLVLGPVVDSGESAPTMSDTCPDTVVIDQCDTGIPALLDDGTCLQTLVDDCAQTATTQDSFVKCVTDLRALVQDSDVDTLTSCAVQAAPRPITSSIGGTGDKEKGKKLSQGKCKDKAVVAVAATIYGGKAGNQITVNAKCGEKVVATVTATDPAGGNLDSKGTTGQQVEGDLKCEAQYAGAAPDSDWLVSCVFFQ